MAAETAFVLLFFLTLIFSIMEFGRYLMVRQLATNAAREGARMALAGTYTYTTSEIEAKVRDKLAAVKGGSIEVGLYRTDDAGLPEGEWTDAAFGEGIGVKVGIRIQTLFPTFGIIPNPMTINANAVMRSEGD